MTVKFRDPISAQACVLVRRLSFVPSHERRETSLMLNPRKTLQKMQGRFFSGRKVEASLWIGKQHFKRSGVAEDVEEVVGDEGEKKRLDAFAHWLLTEGD